METKLMTEIVKRHNEYHEKICELYKKVYEIDDVEKAKKILDKIADTKSVYYYLWRATDVKHHIHFNFQSNDNALEYEKKRLRDGIRKSEQERREKDNSWATLESIITEIRKDKLILAELETIKL